MSKKELKIKAAQTEVADLWQMIRDINEAGELDEEIAQRIFSRIQDLNVMIDVYQKWM